MKENELMPFEGKEIRRMWHNDKWYFSVVDVIGILTGSPNPPRYWADFKRRTEKESGTKVFSFCEPLKMQTAGGRQKVICADTEGVLRIVMSVPSPKAEPLKLWLAQIGGERLQETENPELAFERAREIYKAKGYPDDWIGYREKSIIARKQLTDEWKQRGVKEGQEYSILTATIAKGTFNVTPSEHSKLKGLEKENLRDHMTLIELILTGLSEEVTRQITVRDDAKGFNENYDAALKGGQVGGKARRNVEEATGKKVVSTQNFLNLNDDKIDGLPPDYTDQ